MNHKFCLIGYFSHPCTLSVFCSETKKNVSKGLMMFATLGCVIMANSNETSQKKPYVSLRDVYERCAAEPGQSYQESCEKWYQKFADEANNTYSASWTKPSGTVLHHAVGEGRLPEVELLIKIGANINALHKYKRTPLVDAAFYKHYEIAQLLLSKGANPDNCVDRFTGVNRPLIEAVFNGDLKMAKLLVEAGADLYAIDVDGKSAVGRAWERSEYAILDYFRQHEQSKK